MTRTDALKMFAVLKGAYPHSYSNVTEAADVNNMISLWCDMFDGDDDKYIGVAIKAYITTDTSGFAPSIGKIKQLIQKLKQPEEMTEVEAWGLVMQALKNSAYNAEKEYSKLPAVIQRILGSHHTLQEWALIDRQTLSTVVASNFMRSYKARAKNERDYLALPQSVRDVAKQLGSGFDLNKLIEDKGENQ